MNTLRPLFALTALTAFAPVSQAADFFGATRVHELSLTIARDEWEAMAPARGRGNGGPMQMEFPEVKGQLVLDGKPYEIGVRFKGNSSYMMSSRGLKRPFKLDLNKYVKGQSHEGQTKLNLNNNFSDATQVRETLAYELFHRLGVPASRTTFARVVVNVPGLYENKVLGLYTIAEQVGGAFLKSRFNTEEGMLLKPEGARGGIPDLGENWSDYARIYDPKGDPTAAEKARLIAFTKLIHHADDETFAKEIGSYLDIEAFAKFLAGNVVSANGDSILSMGHNYYLWHSRKTDRFAFIPWDLNMAFGGFPIGDPVKLSIDKPYAGENKLIARFLALPAGKAAYQKACRDAAHYLQELGPLYDQVSAIARPVAAQDAKDVVNNGGPGGFGGPPGGFRPGGGQGGFPGGPPPGGGQGGFPGGPPPGGGFGPPPGGQNGFRPGGGRGPGGPGGRGPGMMGGPELKPFLSQRAAHVLAQLAGTEKGVEPQGGFGPGGGRGPGGPGGPGGFPGGGDFAGMIGGGVSQLAGVGENPSVTAWGDAWKKRAAAWDKNRDETLTRDEVIAGAGAVFGDGFGPGQFLGPQLWGAFKTDAPIPVATFTAALAKWGAAWDTDKDGKLTAVEMGNGVLKTFPQPDFGGGFPGGPGGPGGF